MFALKVLLTIYVIIGLVIVNRLIEKRGDDLKLDEIDSFSRIIWYFAMVMLWLPLVIKIVSKRSN